MFLIFTHFNTFCRVDFIGKKVMIERGAISCLPSVLWHFVITPYGLHCIRSIEFDLHSVWCALRGEIYKIQRFVNVGSGTVTNEKTSQIDFGHHPLIRLSLVFLSWPLQMS